MKINSQGIAKDEDIGKLEADLNINVPKEFKDFLRLNNGANTSETYLFSRKVDNFPQENVIEKFFSIEEIYRSHKNLKEAAGYKDMVAIASTFSAPTICIGVAKENFGFIYVYDGDFGATLQSHSFHDFLDELKRPDDTV